MLTLTISFMNIMNRITNNEIITVGTLESGNRGMQSKTVCKQKSTEHICG